MGNLREKGCRSRLKIIKLLQEEGYLVDVVEKTGKFVSPKDMYGLFDLCCINEGNVLFVQVATNEPHAHKPLKEFALKYGRDEVKIYQYVVRDRSSIELFAYDGRRQVMARYRIFSDYKEKREERKF